MNNTTKMLLPVTALCIYCSGCVAYETPVYQRTPTYVAPTTTYVTEPAYIAPVSYSTTTYVAEPIYVGGGYRHHSVGHIPPHGKYGSGPRHSPHGPHIGTPGPQKAAIHSTHSAQKAAIHSAHSAQKSAAHSAKSAQKAAAKALKHH